MNKSAQFRQALATGPFKNSSGEGFSLIELVVVIGVLAILASIGISSFIGVKENAADALVKISMQNTFKECKLQIIRGQQIPTFTIMLGLHATNGYYKFYQGYIAYKGKDKGTTIGNCLGPLGSNRIGVKKVKGENVGGELWMDLDTGEKTESGGLTWQ
ncbi:MAG: Uncharacterised protein [Prochlorococcus marinus str. MIT 9215]|nr:MAG: Uncharacterised protein [Prochlorococcus marinus str. MIT 9215]